MSENNRRCDICKHTDMCIVCELAELLNKAKEDYHKSKKKVKPSTGVRMVEIKKNAEL